MFGDFQKNSYGERNMRFGVREHAMGAIANGEGPRRTALPRHPGAVMLQQRSIQLACSMRGAPQAA